MNGLLGYALKVTYLDSTSEVVMPTGGDGILFERHFEIPFGAIYTEDGVRLEHLWYLAWLGTKRAHEVPEFDAWFELVDEVAREDPPKASRKRAAVPLAPTS